MLVIHALLNWVSNGMPRKHQVEDLPDVAMELVCPFQKAPVGVDNSFGGKTLPVHTRSHHGPGVGVAWFGNEQDQVDVVEPGRRSKIAAGDVTGFGCPLGDASTSRPESRAGAVRGLQKIKKFDGWQYGHDPETSISRSACGGTGR